LPDIGPLKTRLRLMKRPVSGRYARPTGHAILRAKSDSPIWCAPACYVTATDSKAVVAALKRIDQSVGVDEAAAEMDALASAWGEKYRVVVRIWRDNWANVIPFFQFPPEIRKVVYTTNAIINKKIPPLFVWRDVLIYALLLFCYHFFFFLPASPLRLSRVIRGKRGQVEKLPFKITYEILFKQYFQFLVLERLSLKFRHYYNPYLFGKVQPLFFRFQILVKLGFFFLQLLYSFGKLS
jgi:hypothetical protein